MLLVFALGRKCLQQRVLSKEEAREALFAIVVHGLSEVEALKKSSPATRDYLQKNTFSENPLRRLVLTERRWLDMLPKGVAWQFLVVPFRQDPVTLVIDVAMVFPDESHLITELSYHLRAPVRAIETPQREIERVLHLLSIEQPKPGVPRSTAPFATEPVEHQNKHGGHDLRSKERSKKDIAVSQVTHRSTFPPPSPLVLLPIAQEKISQIQPQVRGQSVSTRALSALSPVLEKIDIVSDRDALVDALLRGLSTFSLRAGLLAPKQGAFRGIACSDAAISGRFIDANVLVDGAVLNALDRGEHLGPLDVAHDRTLALALGPMQPNETILIFPAWVGGKTALLLVAWGLFDEVEASRRARALASAAGQALHRLLRSNG